MRKTQLLSQTVEQLVVEDMLQVLHDRGVELLKGCIFVGGTSRGVPPEGAMTPQVVMQQGMAPLTVSEQAAAILFIRDQVLAVLAAELADHPMSVDVAAAHYCFTPQSGVDLVVEMHGLVDRVARVSLN